MMECAWSLLGPLQWIQYVNKHVKVLLKDEKAGKDGGGKDEELRGVLLTVDPVTASPVLVTLSPGGARLHVVLGHNVQSVEVLESADPDTIERVNSLLQPEHGPDSNLTQDELEQRRRTVKLWLQSNRIPVEEDQAVAGLRVGGVLTITAPYGPEDCQCSNQIILDRVQNLLKNQPDNE